MLENYGRFTAEDGALIDEGRSGIYCGCGEYVAETVRVYRLDLSEYDGTVEANAKEVGTEEELIRALEDTAVEAVRIRTDLTVEQDMTVRKPVYLDGCILTMAGQAKLVDYGSTIVLKNGASLVGNSVSLYEGAQLFLNDSGKLAVEGGELRLNDSLLWGGTEGILLNGTEITVEYNAGFAFGWLGVLQMDDSKLTVRDQSCFVVPEAGSLEVHRAEITLVDEGEQAQSCLYVCADTIFEECSLTLASGALYHYTDKMELNNCTVSIGENGSLISDCANLLILGGTRLENRGYMSVSGWDEFLFQANGTIKNFGRIDLNLPLSKISLSAPIDNQGELYDWRGIFEGDTVEVSRYVAGNAPINAELQE